MKKTLAFLLVLLALAGTVIAIPYFYSVRATDGTVNYVGSDTTFSSTTTKFSAYGNGMTKGEAGLSIIAETSSGEQVRLYVRMYEPTPIQIDDNRIYVNNKGTATYWKQGSGLPQIIEFGTVRYDINKNTGLTNIAGESLTLNFRITGMQTTILKG